VHHCGLHHTIIILRPLADACCGEFAAALAIGVAVHWKARVRQAALKPNFSTTDWAADCAEDPEHDADHHKDSADRVKNRKACEVSNQEKDDAEHNHGQSDPVRRVLELAYE
jgi:hypothetical protein